MEMELEFGQDFAARQDMRVSPRLVAANYILEMSSQELQQAIAQELNENPALEFVEVATCQACGGELHGSICPRCIQRQKGDDYPADGYTARDAEAALRDSRTARDDEFDPLTLVASEQTLAEKLLSDLATLVPRPDLPIAGFLVGSLDERGYLTVSLD